MPEAGPDPMPEPARRPRRKAAKEAPPSPAPHLERSTSWAGLRAGERVRVDGVRERSAVWSFVAYVRNARSGEEWVEVAGGRLGAHAVRSFRPEQIFPFSGSGPRAGKRSAAASLADAPRLPL